jgi:hypothetical protein
MSHFNTYIPKFNDFLREKNLFFEGVVIGGAAMQLMEISLRVTKDCDILYPQISEEVKNAAVEFGKKYQLEENWLNNGPSTLIKDLPTGWDKNLVEVYNGTNLKLSTLSRLDFLRSKLFAFIDRGIDLGDVILLAPSFIEIESITSWLKERDANPDWPEYVDIRLKELFVELKYDSE